MITTYKDTQRDSFVLPQPVDARRRVVEFLRESNIPGAEQLRIELDHGTMILRGWLPSMNDKWRFLEYCEHLEGVDRLIDELGVSSPPGADACTDMSDGMPDGE